MGGRQRLPYSFGFQDGLIGLDEPEAASSDVVVAHVRSIVLNTIPERVQEAGEYYGKGARQVNDFATFLDAKIAEAAEHWPEGDDADAARGDLTVLATSARSLATALGQMETPLTSYATAIQDAKDNPPSSGRTTANDDVGWEVTGELGNAATWEHQTSLSENGRARRILDTLSGEIVGITPVMPGDMELELPNPDVEVEPPPHINTAGTGPTDISIPGASAYDSPGTSDFNPGMGDGSVEGYHPIGSPDANGDGFTDPTPYGDGSGSDPYGDGNGLGDSNGVDPDASLAGANNPNGQTRLGGNMPGDHSGTDVAGLDPSSGTALPGSGFGSGGSGAGASGLGGAGASGLGANAAGMRGGMPMMFPAGAGGRGGDRDDSERSTYLWEDDDVWASDRHTVDPTLG